MKHFFALFFLLLLTSCGFERVGSLDWTLDHRYIDAKITLFDINQDGQADLILSGYQKALKNTPQGDALADSVVAIDGKTHKRIWGYQTPGHVNGYPVVYKDKVVVNSLVHELARK